jgi:hypothetical protein
MEDQLKAIIKRLNSIEQNQNRQDQDRDILEDISIRLGKVEDEVRLLKERVDKGNKDIKAEVIEVHEKVDDLKDQVEKVGEN